MNAIDQQLSKLRALDAALAEVERLAADAGVTGEEVGFLRPFGVLAGALRTFVTRRLASVERQRPTIALGDNVGVVSELTGGRTGEAPARLVAVGPKWIRVVTHGREERFDRERGVNGYVYPHIHPDDLARINRDLPRKRRA